MYCWRPTSLEPNYYEWSVDLAEKSYSFNGSVNRRYVLFRKLLRLWIYLGQGATYTQQINFSLKNLRVHVTYRLENFINTAWKQFDLGLCITIIHISHTSMYIIIMLKYFLTWEVAIWGGWIVVTYPSYSQSLSYIKTELLFWSFLCRLVYLNKRD